MSTQSMTGVVTNVVTEKGFGFIKASDGQEYFFHRSEVRGIEWQAVLRGLAVSFTPTEGPKGPRASAVSAHDARR